MAIYDKANGSRSQQRSQLNRIIYYNKICSYLHLQHIKNSKTLKIQKHLIIQKKTVIGLHKALVACKQKGNIYINKNNEK